MRILLTCSKCSTSNSNDARFCVSCGGTLTPPAQVASSSFAPPPPPPLAVPNASVSSAGVVNTAPIQSAEPDLIKSDGSVSFVDAIKTCLRKYFTFNGTASRSEFWWFYLFSISLSLILNIVLNSPGAAALCNLLLLMPNLTVACRRLHDTGRSGWWQLLVLTFIGVLVLLYWFASESKQQDNKYRHPDN